MTDSKMSKWARLWGTSSTLHRPRRRRQRTRLSGETLEQRRLLAADLLDLPLPMSPLSPLGSRGFESRLELNLASVGEVDQVTVDLAAGQPLSLQLLPQTAGMQTTLNLLNAAGDSIASATAPLAGSPVSLSNVPILEDGTYRILVSTLGGSGDVVLSALTSVTLEYETTWGSNDTWENAENLAGRDLTIDGNATRYLVRGLLSDDQDWYRFPVLAGQSIEIASDNLRGKHLELFDSSGSTIAFSDNGQITSYTASESGELRLLIAGGAGPLSEYTVNITVDAALGSRLASSRGGARVLVESGIAYGRLSSDMPSPIRVAVHASPYDSLESGVISQLNDDTFFDFDAVRVTADQIDTLAELSAFDVVVLGTPYEPLNLATATAIRDFYNAGGGVVATGWFGNAHYNLWESTELGQALNAVLPVTIGSSHRFPSANITITDSSPPVTAGVSSFASGGSTDFYAAVDADATVLGTVNSASAISVVERGGRSAYLPATYFWDYSNLRTGDADRLLEQAVAWAAQGDSVDSYEFVGGTGELTISVTPHQSGRLAPTNDSQFLVELFDIDGPTPAEPIATASSTTGGAAPPDLVFDNTTGAPRRYVTSIHTIAGSGDYELVVTNSSAPTPEPLNVIATSLPEEEYLTYFSPHIQFTFDRPILVSSVDPFDLTISGTSASAFGILDSRTIVFEFDDCLVSRICGSDLAREASRAGDIGRLRSFRRI